METKKIKSPIIKVGIVILALIIVTIGVKGFMSIFPSERAITNEILTHLYDKYGVEFEVIRLQSLGGGDFVLHCFPRGGRREADYVQARLITMRGGERIREIHDNYFGIKIREDLEADVSDAIEDLPLPKKVFFSTHIGFPNIFDGSKTYADLIQWVSEGNSWSLDVTIVISADSFDESEKEAYAEQIFEKIEQDSSVSGVIIRFYPNEVFEKNTRTNYIELTRQYSNVSTVFIRDINRGIHEP